MVPHRYVTKEVLDRLREELAKRNLEISDIKAISRRDSNGIDLFLKRVKLLLEAARGKKDTAMDGLMEDGHGREGMGASLIDSRIQERMSLIFRGEEKAFEAVIELFEHPDAAADIFIRERDEIQKRLAEYEKLEIREPVADQR